MPLNVVILAAISEYWRRVPHPFRSILSAMRGTLCVVASVHPTLIFLKLTAAAARVALKPVPVLPTRRHAEQSGGFEPRCWVSRSVRCESLGAG